MIRADPKKINHFYQRLGWRAKLQAAALPPLLGQIAWGTELGMLLRRGAIFRLRVLVWSPTKAAATAAALQSFARRIV